MSEKNKKNTPKKWLISRLKTSGSKRRRAYSPDYSRPDSFKIRSNPDDLPTRGSMSTYEYFYNVKINTDLLKRFLKAQVGNDWDDVYSEIIARIPTKLHEYRDAIYWYVTDKAEFKEDKLWDARCQRFIPMNREDLNTTLFRRMTYKEFYVDPETNILCSIKDWSRRGATKGLNKEGLRKYRENERLEKLIKKRANKTTEADIEKAERVLKERKNAANISE